MDPWCQLCSKESCPFPCNSSQECSAGTGCSGVWQKSGLRCSCLWGAAHSARGCSLGCLPLGLTPSWQGKLRQSCALGTQGVELGCALQWVMDGRSPGCR